MAGRKVQPVSFNLEDPFEYDLYSHAITNGAFSKYIKRLIQRDKEGVGYVPNAVAIEESRRRGNAKSFV